MEQRRITFQDTERRYVLVPPENPEDTPQDLLLVFHGSLQSPNVIRRFTDFTFDALASCNTIVAYPGGIHNHFNDARKHLPEKTRELGTDDVGFTQAVVDELRKEYNIGRIFACGYSNGGQMVLRLLFDAPGLLSGAAVFAATLAACENLAPTNPIEAYQPTPLLMIHGTLDDKAPYEGGMAGIHAKRTRGEVLSA
ncbi:MAG: alpha/beta hydrolase family esterase, partial [Corynebacterium casei]